MLTYTLRGIDLVISTISQDVQINLIDAAATAQVRHFVPSTFSGPLQVAVPDGAQSMFTNLLKQLEYHKAQNCMSYTIFTCGVFFERFGPGGLNALQISTLNSPNSAIGQEGVFLVDVRSGTATIPIVNDTEELSLCLISARDTARYLVAALQACENLAMWPIEFKFCTERLTMSQLITVCSRARGEFVTLFDRPC